MQPCAEQRLWSHETELSFRRSVDSCVVGVVVEDVLTQLDRLPPNGMYVHRAIAVRPGLSASLQTLIDDKLASKTFGQLLEAAPLRYTNLINALLLARRSGVRI